jgi:hypothetical protein
MIKIDIKSQSNKYLTIRRVLSIVTMPYFTRKMIYLTLIRGTSATDPWTWLHVSPPRDVLNKHQTISFPLAWFQWSFGRISFSSTSR